MSSSVKNDGPDTRLSRKDAIGIVVFLGPRCLVFMQLDPDHPGSPPFWNKVYDHQLFGIGYHFKIFRSQVATEKKSYFYALIIEKIFYANLMVSQFVNIEQTEQMQLCRANRTKCRANVAAFEV